MTPVLPATVPIHAFVHRVLQVFRVQVKGCSLLLFLCLVRLEACTFSSLQVVRVFICFGEDNVEGRFGRKWSRKWSRSWYINVPCCFHRRCLLGHVSLLVGACDSTIFLSRRFHTPIYF